MLRLISALLIASIPVCAQLKISVYATAGDVLRFLEPEPERTKAEAAMRRLNVSHIFLEGRRGDEYVPPETLARLRDHFKQQGIKTTGAIATVPGKTFGVRQNEGYGWLNFEAPETRAGIERFFRENAAVFDEIIVDDFYCTGDTSPASQQARVSRSWSDYRRDLLVSSIEPLMIRPAREVNPRVRLIMKFPQWYDRFDVYGYDPARMAPYFPVLWAGTEVRNPDTPRMGFVPPTEGFVNYSWIRSIAGAKLHGAWFDHIESTAQNFVDQAFQSVLAGAREITLFHLGDLMEPHPGDALLAEKLPELQDLAAKIASQTRRGVPHYKPVNSPAGDNRFLMDYLALIGIPLLPTASYPADAPVAFLGLQAAHDPALLSKVRAQLSRGATVAVTPALLRAVPDLQPLAGVRVSAQPNPATAGQLNSVSLEQPLEIDAGLEAASAQVRIKSSAGPVLTSHFAGRGQLLVYNLRTFSDDDYAAARELLLPPLRRGISDLPREAADLLRDPLLKPLRVQFSAPARVSLTMFEGRVFIYNFMPQAIEFQLNRCARTIPANGWLWEKQ